MEVEGIGWGPTKLQEWSDKVAEAINTNQGECVTRHGFGSPTNPAGSAEAGVEEGDGGGDAGGGSKNLFFVDDGVLYSVDFVISGTPVVE